MIIGYLLSCTQERYNSMSFPQHRVWKVPNSLIHTRPHSLMINLDRQVHLLCGSANLSRLRQLIQGESTRLIK